MVTLLCFSTHSIGTFYCLHKRNAIEITVFSNRNISRSIVDVHDNNLLGEYLNKFMDDLARGGIDRSQSEDF